MKIISNFLANDILARDLKDGQIGVITKWGETIDNENYEGLLVQATESGLVVLGTPQNHGWSNKMYLTNECKVTILNPGTIIEL